MQFLYPKSRQFPFDEVCETIVHELERRNWSVPGMTVTFSQYGSGEQKCRYVSVIRGEDFKIRFCRAQGRVGDGPYNDIAAVSAVVIPCQELSVYSDESGPTFYLYVGQDWGSDRQVFMDHSKCNSKLNKAPRTYLQYGGACTCGSTAGAGFEAVGLLSALVMRNTAALSAMTHTHQGRRSPLLVHTNDLGREYDPEGDEPRSFSTKAVMEEIGSYFEEVVLRTILSCPVPDERIDIFAPATPTPLPSTIGDIFCFAEWRDVQRILQGQNDPTTLPLAERYGLQGSGYRLVPLGEGDSTVPKTAYEGFLWCGLDAVEPNTPIESLDIPGRYRWPDRERFVVRVKPDHADGIYIADHAVYEQRRREIGDSLTDGRTRFTDSEVNDFICARGRTIVPVSEYQGGFIKPVVLINRELSLSEVEVVSGPHTDRSGR